MPAKNSPYECGFEAFEDARMKFEYVRLYLIAILFILFDLEIAFLLPWAVALQDVGMAGFVRYHFPEHLWLWVLPTNGKRAPWIGNEHHVILKKGHTMIEGVFKEGFITTSYDAVANCGPAGLIWPYDIWPGLLRGRDDARCQFAHYDLARFGRRCFRPSPRQSDLMIVAGTLCDEIRRLLCARSTT